MSRNNLGNSDAISVSQSPVHITSNEHSDTIAASNDNTSGRTVGQPTEQLEIDDNQQVPDDTEYPTGLKVWFALGAMYISFFLAGLDLTIVAVAVPSLTDHFGTVDDIGWYSAAYGLMCSAFFPFFGKACTVLTPKSVFLAGLVVFLLGSIVCTFAQTSKAFICGRAIAGLGVGGVNSGCLTLIAHMFPSHKRSIWLSLASAASSIGLSCAPAVGGALIDKFSWRACFGINIPLCPLATIFSAYCITDPIPPADFDLPFREKLKRLDLVGTVVVVPSIACLLLGLQWGGIKYGWSDARIVVLFVVFAVLAIAFGYLQYRLGERATVPLRIVKRRSILAAMWFTACCNGVLAITESYTSIYWQGVRGETATVAGLLGLSMIIGLTVGAILAGFGTSIVGYFTPFMIATSIMAPVATGLLTTLNLDESKVKVVALLAFLGLAIGTGLNAPIQAVSTILSPQEVSLGAALTGFSGGLGSAIFISAAATLFQSRLVDEISKTVPGTNTTVFSHAGLSEIRTLIGEDRLRDVLTGYNAATVQTLYMPLGLALLTIVGSASMGWHSVKKKQT